MCTLARRTGRWRYYRADFVHASFPKILSSRDALGPKSPNQKGVVMTATFKKTPILFAALLTVATPAFAGDWRSIPRTDGVCTLYNENLECVDAGRSFLASSTTDGTVA
jgi:hypothetical protein